MIKFIIGLSFLLFSNYAISQNEKTEIQEVATLDNADAIIEKAIDAHGGALYDTASYSFYFRKRKYTFTNNNQQFKYEIEYTTKDNNIIIDKLENEKFTRTVDGNAIDLSKREVDGYSASLNSVIYFATLPHKLKDKAVNKKFIEKATIRDVEYNTIEVTFNKEGGGKDFNDQFYYWINTKTNTVDYFAYSYDVNGGGVRFRSQYNRREIDGVIFQDYINWKAPVGTSLKSICKLFEKGELIEVSRIETEEVLNLK